MARLRSPLPESAPMILRLEPRRDTGRIEGLNPGGGNFGPDGRYFVGLRSKRIIAALSTSLDVAMEHVLPPRVVPFPRGFALVRMAGCFSPQELALTAKAITPSWPLLQARPRCPLDWSRIPN